jgi:hypothetical protein
VLPHYDAGGFQQEAGQPGEHRPAFEWAHPSKPHRIEHHAELAAEPQTAVRQKTGEEAGDPGERVLPRRRVGTLNRDNPGRSAVLGIFADRRVGPVKAMIGARVDLQLDPGSPCGCGVEQLLAWHRRGQNGPDAEQRQQRDPARPFLLPALVAGRRIECDRRPKIAPRQLGGPA